MTHAGPSKVYLAVSYAEKDEAKLHGARWDADRRQWWIERRHLSNNPGIRKWMVDEVALAPPTAAGRAMLAAAMRPVTTHPRTFLLPNCTCSTPPWEHCEHTAAGHLR